ncbi:MAG: hypothetical protein CMI32_02070 [Opitutales bacterium]|nr:hypothetical protein [Opitutales bacterium]
MSTTALLKTLNDLRENRCLSSEVSAAIDPFRGQRFALKLSFVSASNTIGNRFGPEYNDGVTLTCKLEGGELEASLQTTPGENAWVESLSPGAPFEARVTLLGFDVLYQRAIFGSLPDASDADTEAIEEAVVAFDGEEPPSEESVEPDESAGEVEGPLGETEKAYEAEQLFEELQPEKEQDAIPEEESDGALPEEREPLLDELGAPTEATTGEAEEKAKYGQVEYEGEEPEWIPVSRAPTTQRQASSPPMERGPEKQGCMGCSVGLKILAVFIGLAFLVIIIIAVKRELDPAADLTDRSFIGTEDVRHDFAYGILQKERPDDADLHVLTETALMILGNLQFQYRRYRDSGDLSVLSRQNLIAGYAWVALAEEAEGRSGRSALHEGFQRNAPFHLMLDGDLIEAKVRIALKNPFIVLNQDDFEAVETLDLSDQRLENFSYLKKLPNLRHVALSNEKSSRTHAQTLRKTWPELRISLGKP